MAFHDSVGRKEDASSRIVVSVISPLVSLMSDQVSSFACHSVYHKATRFSP